MRHGVVRCGAMASAQVSGSTTYMRLWLNNTYALAQLLQVLIFEDLTPTELAMLGCCMLIDYFRRNRCRDVMSCLRVMMTLHIDNFVEFQQEYRRSQGAEIELSKKDVQYVYFNSLLVYFVSVSNSACHAELFGLWNEFPNYDILLNAACPARFQTLNELETFNLDVQNAYFTEFPENAKNCSFTQIFLAAFDLHQNQTRFPTAIDIDNVKFLKDFDSTLRRGDIPNEGDIEELKELEAYYHVDGKSTVTIDRMKFSNV